MCVRMYACAHACVLCMRVHARCVCVRACTLRLCACVCIGVLLFVCMLECSCARACLRVSAPVCLGLRVCLLLPGQQRESSSQVSAGPNIPGEAAPYHPLTQGMIQRSHRTMKNRMLLGHHYLPGDVEASIKGFIDFYNHHRYHESLNKLSPADV